MKLGDVYHPFRRQIIASFPRQPEPKRHQPTWTTTCSGGIVAGAPEHVRPA
jgi:hypothetical protein